MRYAAAEALVGIGKPGVPALVGALRDGDWLVRHAAAQALGRIGDARAVRPLAAAVKDEVRHVRDAARAALQALKRK